MNSLVLVRHGQSLWNKERRFTGWADIDLTEQGKSEAKYAGELIKNLNVNFDAFFTSELKRAIHSMDLILEVLKKTRRHLPARFMRMPHHDVGASPCLTSPWQPATSTRTRRVRVDGTATPLWRGRCGAAPCKAVAHTSA